MTSNAQQILTDARAAVERLRADRAAIMEAIVTIAAQSFEVDPATVYKASARVSNPARLIALYLAGFFGFTESEIKREFRCTGSNVRHATSHIRRCVRIAEVVNEVAQVLPFKNQVRPNS